MVLTKRKISSSARQWTKNGQRMFMACPSLPGNSGLQNCLCHGVTPSLNHGQLESCLNGCHAKSKQTLWTNCCTQEVLAHNKLIVNTKLNYNVTRKFKAGNCVILKVRKIAYVSMYSLLPCYSTQGLQLNHVRRNHLCALKPPASELFWNIFSAARASYHRKRGWAGASCRVHAGARQ